MYFCFTRFSIMALLLMSIAVSVSARELPLGTYQSRLGGDEKSNQWQLQFETDGRYVLLVNGNSLQPIEKGKFKIERATLTLGDESRGPKPKLYHWTFVHKQLRLRLIGEARRVGDVFLTQGPWDKLGDPLPPDPLDAIDTQSLPSELVEWSSHHNPQFREIAADRLRECGEAALPLLVSLLDDEAGYVAEKAAASLAKLGATAAPAKAVLVEAALTRSDWVALDATDAVIKIDPRSDQIVPALQRLMRDENRNVQIAAAATLRDTRPDQIRMVAKALSAMTSEDKYLRSRVADELAKCGDAVGEDGVGALRKLLCDRDEYVRGSAAKAVGQLGPVAKDTLPELIQLLDDENSVNRTYAVVALSEIGPEAKAAVPKLVKIMAERSYLDEGRAATTALRKIAPDQLAAIERRPYLIGGGITAFVLLFGVWLVRRRRKRTQADRV